MSCRSAGVYDEDTGRFSCKVTGDDCFYLFPNSKACAAEFGEGPDSGIVGFEDGREETE